MIYTDSHALGLALLALLTTSSCATGGSPASGAGASAAATPARAAVGTHGDPLRDPALTVGTLPNGMRYYIRANGMPARRAFLWLAVDAGSVLEDDDQQGFAHFLEHMAFNGTAHFPPRALVDFVESSGMQFGSDLNAETGYDQTVYKLTVPTDDPALLRQGLQVLEDWADGGIAIDSGEVVAERGVVMGEWRSRLVDTASQRIRAGFDTALFGGSRYLQRSPIGLPALIEKAEPAAIRRFYKDWYRPDLMAVVAVGDFDPKEMEREIQARFGKVPAAAHPRKRPEPALPSKGTPEVHVIVHEAVTPAVEVLWPAPPAPRDIRAAVRQALVTDLLVQQMERQLLHLQQQPSRPFIHAEVGRGRIVRPLSVVGAEMIAWPDSLERALGTVLAEVERIAQHGLPPEVLERRKAALLRGLEGQAASAGTRSSATYVEEYAQNYLDPEGPLLSADQELTLAREIVPRITPEALAEAARFWRAGKGVKVIVSLPKFAHVRPPTRQSVLAVFDSIRRTPLAPVSGSAAVAEGPLMEQPPAPGRIVAETLHAGAGITEWRLSNGARVLFKPTQNDPDELLIRAWSPGGFSRVPDSLFYGPGRMAAYMMTEAAGLGKLDRDDLRQELATTGVRDFRVDIGYADEAIELAGSPREVETLFQMLHLQFTAPKLDTAALSAWSSNAKYQTRDVSIHDMLNQAFARGNPRLMPVQTQLAELVKVDEALAVYRDRFGNAGDFTFMLVGAATAEQVKPLVERYIASLPATDARETPKDPDVRPLIGAIRLNEKVVPVPRSETLLAFDGSFPTEPAEYLGERQRLSALTLVLERRLRDRLREQLGGTYGVAVEGGTYRLYGEHFRVLVFFQSAPERMRELSREMWGILDSVRTRGATAAELAMAVRMQRRQLETQLQSNQFWLERMQLYNRLGVPLDRIVSPYPADHVTPEELEAAAGKYLPKTAFIQLTNVPSDSTMRAGKDSLDRAGGLSSRR